MTRKDYEKFAAMLAAERERIAGELLTVGNGVAYVAAMGTYQELTLNMAKVFAADNPRFSRERFLNASGFND